MALTNRVRHSVNSSFISLEKAFATVHNREFRARHLFNSLDTRFPSRIMGSDGAFEIRQNYDLSVSEAPKLFSDAEFEAVKRIEDGLKVLVLRKRLQVCYVLVTLQIYNVIQNMPCPSLLKIGYPQQYPPAFGLGLSSIARRTANGFVRRKRRKRSTIMYDFYATWYW